MAKKYDDTKAHSEVLEAVQSGHIKPGRTLDLGCGHGRNALIWHLLGMMLQPLMLITKLHNASK